MRLARGAPHICLLGGTRRVRLVREGGGGGGLGRAVEQCRAAEASGRAPREQRAETLPPRDSYFTNAVAETLLYGFFAVVSRPPPAASFSLCDL
jgi:hypothetical protein